MYILCNINVYIDKSDDIVNRYYHIYHSTIKMKPVDVKSNTYIDSIKELTIEILNLKLVILLEYQNILQKAIFQIGLKRFLSLKRLKTLCRGHLLLVFKRRRNCWNVLRKRIAQNESKRI